MWADLVGALGNIPHLDGAACKADPQLFDADHGNHSAAIEICGHCPALTACREWLDSLGPRSTRRPIGVVAGQVLTGRRGRPPQHPAA